PGIGSSFQFTTQVAVGKNLPASTAKLELAQLLGLPVLVVDDNSTNRRILGDTVTRWGMKPELVASGVAGLQAMREASEHGQPFRLVLSDMQMPDMDGLAFAARIGEIPELAPTPIILLTSGQKPGDAARSRQLAVASHLSKPVARSELLTAI